MRVCRICNALMEDDMIFCPECAAKYLKHDTTVYAAAGSPAIIIMQDLILSETDGIKAGFTLANISEKTITACRILLKCQDAFGEAVADTVIKLSDLQADQYEFFGDNQMFALADASTRSFQIVLDKIIFDDGTSWDDSGLAFEPTEQYAGLLKQEADQLLYSSVWEQALEINRKKDEVCAFRKQMRDKQFHLAGQQYLEFKALAEKEEKKCDALLHQYLEELTCLFESTPDVIIPDGTNVIPAYLFSKVKSICSIRIPDSVTELNECFGSCSATHIYLPNTLTKINYHLFARCKMLTELTIPSSVTEITDIPTSEDIARARKFEAEYHWADHLAEKISPFSRDGELRSLIIPDIFLQTILKVHKMANLEWIFPENCVVTTHSGINYTEYIQIKKQISGAQAKAKRIKRQIDNLKKSSDSAVPSEAKKSDLQKELADLKTRQGSLGIFKGKEKKALQEQIDTLSTQLPALDTAIEQERRQQTQAINDAIRPLNKKLTQQQQLISELQSKITELEEKLT